MGRIVNACLDLAEIAKEHAENEFEKYRVIQDRLFKSDFDKEMELFNEEDK